MGANHRTQPTSPPQASQNTRTLNQHAPLLFAGFAVAIATHFGAATSTASIDSPATIQPLDKRSRSRTKVLPSEMIQQWLTTSPSHSASPEAPPSASIRPSGQTPS